VQGFREHTGDALNSNFADPQESSQDAITAGLSAGGQAGAYPLTAKLNRVSSANSTDGVRLPASKPGLVRFIWNNSGNSIRVFPATGDAINGGSPNASVNVANNNLSILICTAFGNWYGALALA